MPTQPTTPQVALAIVGIAEACRRLDCSKSHLYDLFRTGTLKPYKVGSRTVVFEHDLTVYLQALAPAEHLAGDNDK